MNHGCMCVCVYLKLWQGVAWVQVMGFGTFTPVATLNDFVFFSLY
jgi:hypothetical protein